MYAIIETGGKQYRVQPDDVLTIERLDSDPGAAVRFDRVLAVGEGNDLKVGTPMVDGAVVTAELIEQFRGKKQRVFKIKRRKGNRRLHGHRQEQSKVRILEIQT